MNIYTQKKRWKILLFVIAIIIVGLSLFIADSLVHRLALEEREKVKLWADAIQKKASLVNYTESLFEKLKNDERRKIDIWSKANKKLILANYNEDITFYAEIISNNNTIPVVLTDKEGKITAAINVDFNKDTVKYLSGNLKKEFTLYEPLVYNYYGNSKVYLYYKDSYLFSELKIVLNDLIKSFLSEVAMNSASVPVIMTDSSKTNIITFGNIDSSKIKDKSYLVMLLKDMKSQNEPIKIQFTKFGENYIFYKDSYLLTQLRFYPYIQFLIIGLFLFVSYFLFSTSRNAEQNKVWMGMAKETAHQLGTPLSSLMAWYEILKESDVKSDILEEINKDISRLDKIADRFSKIGSPPKLNNENIVEIIYNSIDYLRSRTSQEVIYKINKSIDTEIIVHLNPHLFEWVIENLCKNAIDAMNGVGFISIDLTEEAKFVIIDVSDTGKGLTKSKFKAVFNPGYTSKQRGWGLGLSLAKRIVEHYHSGKIFVKSSILNKGTTFRIVLKK